MRVADVVVRIVAVAVTCALPAADGARILAVQTVAGKSHWNFVSSVLRAMTDNGHSVTVYTPFVDGDRENYTEVDISGKLPNIVGKSMTELTGNLGRVFNTVPFAVMLGRFVCTVFHEDRRLRALLSRDLRADFDAVLLEPLPPNCLSYLAAKSDLPLIYAFPMTTLFRTEFETFGDVSNPATVTFLTSGYAVPKTFVQRFSNTIYQVYCSILTAFHEFLQRTKDPKPYDAYPTVMPSLVFLNSHYTVDAPRPGSLNFVNVGGIHLKPAKDLPKDVLEFIEDSPHGVILFTFGSTVLMTTIPENIQKIFMDVLGQLPQRVLLKYEHEMIDKPKNVMTRKWFPQRDILLHPKVKLFISHGGISGLYEAIDAGVPVLGFPLFTDQYRNIDNLVNAGMAISMEILSISKDAFLKNVVSLVNDEKYAENAKIASKVFKDQPMSPEKKVVYWTEYVIRHKGAPQLKSNGLNLSLYQYFLSDVIGAVLFCLIIVLFVTFRVFKIVKKYIFTRF